jgi:PEP-CTERM motif
MKTQISKQLTTRQWFIKSLWAGAMALVVACAITPAAADSFDFKDWSWSFNNSAYTYTNTSSAGTITGSSNYFAAYPGTWGIPYAITTQPPFSTEFQVSGTSGVGQSVTFNFSSGYNWGTGGQMILGNIHNYFEYTLSAWDFNNQPINVNNWNILAEYPSSAPGTLGYFSTSSTLHSAAGNSENFYVDDPLADPNGGQGGVLQIAGLQDVGKMQLTLTSSDLGQNAQQGDFILFNVGTPTDTPEPGSLALFGTGVLGLAGVVRRKLRG